MRIFLIIAALCLCAAPAAAQQLTTAQTSAQPPTLNNQSIIEMKGLSAEIIKAKIKNSTWNFDTSKEEMIKLKQAGVDDNVILMMVQNPTGPPKDRYVAEFYQYLGSLQLSGTNFVPSLFNPRALGILYIVLLGIIWVGIMIWRGQGEGRRTWPLLISFFVVVIIVLLVGANISSDNLGKNWSAVHTNTIDFRFVKQPIRGADPCAQSFVSPQGTPPPSGKPTGAAADPTSSSAAPGSGMVTAGGNVPCKQPETSPTPADGDTIGMIAAADGGSGRLLLKRKATDQPDYTIKIEGIERAGKYEGKIAHDNIGPADLRATVVISDWWPYFFITVLVGIVFSNNTFKLQTGMVSEDVKSLFNGQPINTISGLAAIIITIYSQYGAGWGAPTDYIKAFLLGAGITLGVKLGLVATITLVSKLRGRPNGSTSTHVRESE